MIDKNICCQFSWMQRPLVIQICDLDACLTCCLNANSLTTTILAKHVAYIAVPPWPNRRMTVMGLQKDTRANQLSSLGLPRILLRGSLCRAPHPRSVSRPDPSRTGPCALPQWSSPQTRSHSWWRELTSEESGIDEGLGSEHRGAVVGWYERVTMFAVWYCIQISCSVLFRYRNLRKTKENE